MNISWERDNRLHFDNFRSEICHFLKSKGDVDFVTIIIKENWIERFWKWGWKEESLYILAVLDYLSDLYKVSPYNKYDWYRTQKLEEI